MPASFYQSIQDIAAYWNKFKSSSNIGPDESTWIQRVALLDEFSARNSAFVGLWSTVTPDRFIYVTDKSKLLGYDAALLTAENGVVFSYSNLHPHYVRASYSLQEKGFNYIIEKQVKPLDGIVVTFDVLYKRWDDIYIHTLQQVTLLEVDDWGKPLLTLSLISDISHIKKPGTCQVTIALQGEVEIHRYNFDEKHLEKVKSFSEQEKKVLQLLSRGLTTKEIADKLFISPHTVDTHRRNLIKKTDCLDTTAVVTYARMIGLL